MIKTREQLDASIEAVNEIRKEFERCCKEKIIGSIKREELLVDTK